MTIVSIAVLSNHYERQLKKLMERGVYVKDFAIIWDLMKNR